MSHLYRARMELAHRVSMPNQNTRTYN
jgi:hypothetical protein